jgi:hypothetical protein
MRILCNRTIFATQPSILIFTRLSGIYATEPGGVSDHPAVDRGVIDVEPTLGHHHLDVPERELVLEIPADAE